MATVTEPSFRRESRTRSSPWPRVFRREPELIAAADPPSCSPPPPLPPAAAVIPPLEPSDRAPPSAAVLDDQAAGTLLPSESDAADRVGGGNVAAAERGRKPAWSMPCNDAADVATPVMDAVSWPALSEVTKGSPKPPSSDSVKPPSDGSASAPAPVTPSSPPKQIAKDTNFRSSANNGSPKPHKSMELGDSSSSGSRSTDDGGGGGLAPLPSLPPASAQLPEGALDKAVTSQPYVIRDHRNTRSWDQGSRGGGCSPQSQGGNEHYRNYGNRRGNSSGGAVGSHHHNFVNRRGVDRSSNEWNNRSFAGVRDVKVHQQQQQQPRALARHFLQPIPPVSTPFMSQPPPVPPFASPMFYDITSPPYYVPTHPSSEFHGNMSFTSTQTMIYASPDLHLRAILASQIDYYFSPANLCKDIYLRQNMDGEGWVSIYLIANFNRVRKLTNNLLLILDTVRNSAVVEVQGDKIRRRGDWMNWPPLCSAPNLPPSSISPSSETLTTHVRNVKLDEESTSQNSKRATGCSKVVLSRSSSELSSQSPASSGKGSGRFPATCPDQSVPDRSLGRSDTF